MTFSPYTARHWADLFGKWNFFAQKLLFQQNPTTDALLNLPKPPALIAKECLKVFALFVLLTFACFYYWFPYFGTSLIGFPEDNMQDFWNTWYTVTGNDTQYGYFYTKMLQYPEGTPLFLHTFAYPKLVFIYFLTAIFGHDTSVIVVLHNLFLVLTFPLSGTAAYLLLRFLGGNCIGALIGSFIYAFNPWHYQQFKHHVGVSSVEFLPLFVLAWLCAREYKTIGWFLAAVLFYAMNALSSWYYLIYLGVFMIFHEVFFCLYDKRNIRLQDIQLALGCIALVLIFLSPLLVPMFGEMVNHDLSKFSAASDVFVVDALSFITPPSSHILRNYSQSIYQHFTGNRWECCGYLGIVNIALLIWAFFFVKEKNKRVLAYSLAGLVTFALLACGDTLHVLGQSTIVLPGIFYHLIPTFDMARTPSRHIIFAYLFLSIGISYAMTEAWKRLAPKASLQLLFILIAALLALDFYPAHAAQLVNVQCQPGLEIMRDDPDKDFGILEMPRGNYVDSNYFMMQQMCHMHPIVQGNPAYAIKSTLRDYLITNNLAEQKKQLTDAKVKYVVLYKQFGPYFQWNNVSGVKADYLSTYQKVYESDRLIILRVY
jgi:hypothetical protein